MNRISLSFAAVALLAACGEIAFPGTGDSSDEAPKDEVASNGAATTEVDQVQIETAPARPVIDWKKAREDFERDSADDSLVVQAQSAGDAPPSVPMLLPTGIVVPQSEAANQRIMQMEDGYFASYPGARYDIVVNGTNRVALVEGAGASEDRAPNFTATVAGAQVALSRYGANYLIEFECNVLDIGGQTCIEENEALDIADRLIVARTR